MTDYARLRNRAYQEYMDIHTEANRRAWRIEQKAVNMMEAPLAPSADIGTIASNAKLGSNLVSLLKDVLNNVRLRTVGQYLLLKPSTLDFSKAKEVLNEYINELRYTVMPILRNSSGNNNTLLSNTFNSLSEILSLLNMIVSEFNKVELKGDEIEKSALNKYQPENVNLVNMTDRELDRYLNDTLSNAERRTVEDILKEREKEEKERIYEGLISQGKNPVEARREANKFKFDTRTTLYNQILQEAVNEVDEKTQRRRALIGQTKEDKIKPIYQFYQAERDNFLEYRDTIIGLVKTLSNYQSADIPYTYGTMDIKDLYDRLVVYIIAFIGNKEAPKDLRKQYPLMKDLPDFSNTVKDNMNKEKFKTIIDSYLERVRKRLQLNSINSITSEYLNSIYQDLITHNIPFRNYIKEVGKQVHSLYRTKPNRLADDGRDIKNESAPIDLPTTSTTGLSVEDAPIQPDLPVEQDEDDEKLQTGEGRQSSQVLGRRRYKKPSNPRIVYDGAIKEDKMMKMGGKSYALLGNQSYNPVQSLLDRFNEGERRYMDELTKDNLRFRVHRKTKK